MNIGFLIPVYNHGKTLDKTISSLEQFKLPFIIVDDGNNDENKKLIAEAAKNHKNVTVVANAINRGKGFAVKVGMIKASEMGLTHMFQIDADGQHDAKCCSVFLEKAKENPEALICGYPKFDSSVPSKRKNGREISNGYARFVTWDKSIVDAMCGFRIYPVEPFVNIYKHFYVDSFMGFDTEILVRLIWKNIKVIYEPVNVFYPVGGVSNFRMFRDNVHISFMFIRMTLGMFARLPILCYRAIKR